MLKGASLDILVYFSFGKIQTIGSLLLEGEEVFLFPSNIISAFTINLAFIS